MHHFPVIIIGGGITGIGVLRDLSMRGVKALLLEQKDLSNGASSRFHGLLHSGARYAVNDPVAGAECIKENEILRNIASNCIEFTEGIFASIPEDDEEYEKRWFQACQTAGVRTVPLTVKEALRLEPNLSENIRSAYTVPDSAVDGFRLVWQNAKSALRYGGKLRTYAEVANIYVKNGIVTGVEVKDSAKHTFEDISCDYIINASGSWSGMVAEMAGATVNVMPDRGLLLAFNHRFTSHVINRLHAPGDGDIFVPHGSITILGTTSTRVDNPADNRIDSSECLALLEMGKKLFPKIDGYRILRGFAGTRPLFRSNCATKGRATTRNFAVMDHETEGLKGFATIVGGKFTTYRLMAEKISDLVARKLGNIVPCRTADEPLVEPVSGNVITDAKKFFPAMGVNLSISRQGEDFAKIVGRIENDRSKKALLCECELVTRAEFEEIASQSTSHSLGDVRRRTRIGMGTCQGNFCGLRSVGALAETELMKSALPSFLLKNFVEERWHGIRPMLWGTQIKEVELSRGIYGTMLNVDGTDYEE